MTPDGKTEQRDFPPDFLFGTATAALQIEGGDTGNTWYRWCEQGSIRDGSHCRNAADHYARIDEDIFLMLQLKQQTYRMSIEWSRIEPEPGRFNEEAVYHYRYELAALKTAGIRPLVTLHHFSQPLWFEDSGGWMRRDAPQVFLRFARFIARELIDLVSDWVTFNEPNVYLLEGYILGEWPPGQRSLRRYLRGIRTILRTHRLVYRELHRMYAEAGRDVQIGAAHHLRVYDPLAERRGPRYLGQRLLCAVLSWVTQDVFVRGMTARGRSADFLGINYYTRDRISWAWNPATLFTARQVSPGTPVNDLGWEIYPEGLGQVVRRVVRQATRRPFLCRAGVGVHGTASLPVYITENGVCDARDVLRPRFIADHLVQVVQLIQEGIPLQRYYHWSLMDNFEWLEGEQARFGLAAVDYADQKRSIRESGRLYAKIAESGIIMYTNNVERDET